MGIFVRFGLDWRHYRAVGDAGFELFDPGHAPEVAWRPTTPTPA